MDCAEVLTAGAVMLEIPSKGARFRFGTRYHNSIYEVFEVWTPESQAARGNDLMAANMVAEGMSAQLIIKRPGGAIFYLLALSPGRGGHILSRLAKLF